VDGLFSPRGSIGLQLPRCKIEVLATKAIHLAGLTWLGAVHYKSVLRWCAAARPFGSAKVLVNDHATVNLNDGAPNDDPPKLILVIVVGTSLIRVGLAAILLGLAGR